MQTDLFAAKESEFPLAYKIRPQNWDEFIGQKSVKDKISKLNKDNLKHFIFWGPPGTGKTTLAHLISEQIGIKVHHFNAVLGGVPELRKIIKGILELKKFHQEKAIIFIDEIHRFNKAQQDALLPYLEREDFILLGATTEYPQTSLNRAILSRVNTLELKKLNKDDIYTILERALDVEEDFIEEPCLQYLCEYSNGDARYALNIIEQMLELEDRSLEVLKELLGRQARQYDKNSDRHYDVISAFIKSVRGSDVDAAILWLAVMIDGGEDIEFIARRLIILASEDVGNADPRALQIATSAHYAIKNIGMPEARIILAQATAYLARAPKSNASYLAIDKALEYVRNNPTVEVPTHLRNRHPDKKNYKYPHNHPNHWTEQVYDNTNEYFFESSKLGYERLQDDYLSKIRDQ